MSESAGGDAERPGGGPRPGGWARRLVLAAVAVVPLAFWPGFQDALELPKLLAFRVLLCLALAAAALDRDPGARPAGLVPLALLAAVLAEGASAVASECPRLAAMGSYLLYDGWFRTADLAALALLAGWCFREERDRLRLLQVSCAVGVALGAYAVVQHLGWDPAPWDLSAGAEGLKYRSFATLASPSFLALYLAMLLPAVAWLAVSAPRARAAAGWSGAVALLCAGLVLTYSRAGWLAALPAILAFVNAARQRSRVRAGLVAAGAAAGVVLAVALAPARGGPSAAVRAASLLDGRAAAERVRPLLWRGAIGMAASRPLLGWGPGTFPYTLPRFASAGLNRSERQNPAAHDFLLDLLARGGTVGLLAWAGVGWALAVAARRNGRLPEAAGLASLGIGCLFGFASLAPLALAAAWAGSLGTEVGERWPLPRWTPLALLAVCLPGLALTLRWAAADHFAARAARAPGAGTALARWVQACRWYPEAEEYWVRRGETEADLGRSPVASYRGAVSANPLDAASRAALASALDGTDREAALQQWREAVRLDPRWPEARNGLGLALEKSGDLPSALRQFRQALLLDPAYATAWNSLGGAYASQRRWELAEEAYRRAEEIRPGWTVPRWNLVWLTRQRGAGHDR